MEIARSVLRDGSLLPAAIEAISRVPDDVWTHVEQGVLHPRVVYTRALTKITEAWTKVFEELDRLSAQLRFDQPVTAAKVLEAEYGKLLRALNEHVDACYAVMRCLAKPPADAGVWHHKVARKQKLPGLQAFDEQVIKGYREVRLGLAVNLMKHDEARICLLAMRSASALTLGYFIDGPQPSGAIGPSLKVHPGGNSAFSFNRDMLIHWWWLYRSSELLAKVVGQATVHSSSSSKAALPRGNQAARTFSGNPFDRAAAEPAAAGSAACARDTFAALCERIASIRADFMIDEIRQPYPLVVLNKAAATMRIAFPADRRPNSITGDPRFTVLITIDEGGQGYKVPYLGKNADDEFTVEAN